MIRCEESKEWYHGKCVKVTPEEAYAMGDFVRGVRGIPRRRYKCRGELWGIKWHSGSVGRKWEGHIGPWDRGL